MFTPEVAARAIRRPRLWTGHLRCGRDVRKACTAPWKTKMVAWWKNAAPGCACTCRLLGKGRNVGETVASHLIPSRAKMARIPVVAVTGTNGKTTTARLTAHLIATSGLRVGMTNTDGVYVNGRQIDSGDCSGPKSARNVLMHLMSMPLCSKPPGVACCAKAWVSTAAKSLW